MLNFSFLSTYIDFTLVVDHLWSVFEHTQIQREAIDT